MNCTGSTSLDSSRLAALAIRVRAACVPWSCDLNIAFKDLAQVMNM